MINSHWTKNNVRIAMRIQKEDSLYVAVTLCGFYQTELLENKKEA